MSSTVVHIPLERLLFSVVPLGVLVLVSHGLSLGLGRILAISSIRTFLQLMCLGYVLVPIFTAGERNPLVVVLYVFFMICLAAYESVGRLSYIFSKLLITVAIALLVNVGLILLLTFAFLIQLTPFWDPQYVIPMSGMLLGNGISGVSVSMNSLLTNFVERRSELELMLSFGATRYEASRKFLQDAMRSGMMPTINTMSVIGLVSIPGMMTGQLLGGSTPDDAARYQILIMYLIAANTFGSILIVFLVVMQVSFDSSDCLLFEQFAKQTDKNSDIVARFLHWMRRVLTGLRARQDGYSDIENATVAHPVSPPSFRTQILKTSRATKADHDFFHLQGLARSIRDDSTSDTRILFENVNLDLGRGDICLVMGPSGAGKSQFLRGIASLVPLNAGVMTLAGMERKSFSVTKWRQRVLYVGQNKVDLPGDPKQMIDTILTLSGNETEGRKLSLKDMMTRVEKFLDAWGLNREHLRKNWKLLSGGEAQRVLLAIGLAYQPQVLLLDEPTSALDGETKRKVELSIVESCQMFQTIVVWVTHDDGQYKRLEMFCNVD